MKTHTAHTTYEVLRQIPYGLYAVGFRNRNVTELNANVVSWITQCSFDPPMLMVTIRKPSHSYDLLRDGMVFSVNLIDRRHRELVRQLVKPCDHAGDKLGRVGHVEEDTGAPILRKAYAYVECRVKEIYEPGDHALVIGEVVNAGFHDRGEPLMCSDMRWHYAG